MEEKFEQNMETGQPLAFDFADQMQRIARIIRIARPWSKILHPAEFKLEKT